MIWGYPHFGKPPNVTTSGPRTSTGQRDLKRSELCTARGQGWPSTSRGVLPFSCGELLTIVINEKS